LGVSQFVLERLGEGLHACFRDIVGGIAGRRGDALLGAGVDDEAPPSALDHARCKDSRSMDHAPQIDPENPLPIVRRPEQAAAGLNAGIVHQKIRAAEPLTHGGFQFRQVFGPADICCHRHDIGAATWRGRLEFSLGGSQTIGPEIGDADLHAEPRESDRGSKTYSSRTSGDDGDVVG